jgi:3',5'-cyclic AMP phosphodiesterase CpdA
MTARRRLLQLLPLVVTALLLASSRPLLWAAPNPNQLRFLALADSGSGNANQQEVADRMAERHRLQPVDLVLLGGDNIYPNGDIALLQKTVVHPYRALLQAGVPFHAVLGNHDIRTANGVAQLREPVLGMGGRWYNLRRGPVEFFLLDTNTNAAWQHQMPWLKNALARSTAPWKVVVGHHPLYSSGLYGDDPRLQAKLLPLFERYQVQLYINGHEHNYERTLPLHGTTFLIVGGGGAWLRPVLGNRNSARAVSAYSFAEIEVVGDQMRLSAWNAKGKRIDQTVINR